MYLKAKYTSNKFTTIFILQLESQPILWNHICLPLVAIAISYTVATLRREELFDAVFKISFIVLAEFFDLMILELEKFAHLYGGNLLVCMYVNVMIKANG